MTTEKMFALCDLSLRMMLIVDDLASSSTIKMHGTDSFRELIYPKKLLLMFWIGKH